MTRDEAIAYGKEQLEIFGGQHQEFIRMAIEALEHLDNIEAYMHDFDVTEEEAIKALERKKGEWLYKDMKGQFCSVCGKQSVWKFDFCSNCGADMRSK